MEEFQVPAPFQWQEIIKNVSTFWYFLQTIQHLRGLIFSQEFMTLCYNEIGIGPALFWFWLWCGWLFLLSLAAEWKEASDWPLGHEGRRPISSTSRGRVMICKNSPSLSDRATDNSLDLRSHNITHGTWFTRPQRQANQEEDGHVPEISTW